MGPTWVVQASGDNAWLYTVLVMLGSVNRHGLCDTALLPPILHAVLTLRPASASHQTNLVVMPIVDTAKAVTSDTVARCRITNMVNGSNRCRTCLPSTFFQSPASYAYV